MHLGEIFRGAGLVALLQRQHAQPMQRLAPRRIGRAGFLVPLRGLVGLTRRRFDLAQVEEDVAAGGRAFGGLLQRRLRRLRVAPLEIRQGDSDLCLLVVRIDVQQGGVGVQRGVEVLLVPVRGGDLQIDDGERRRPPS